MRFNFILEYTKGINLTVADAQSRSPVNSTSFDTVQQQLEEDIEAHLDSVIRSPWPTSDKFLNKIRDKTNSDVQLSCVIKYVQEVTDNAQCYKSHEFTNFATDWNFCHITSSPRFPQSSLQAESAVKIAKRIMKQSDPLLALIVYRSTPVASTGVSSSELALGRKDRLCGLAVKTLAQRSGGRIKEKLLEPRSYLVATPKGLLRRNRKHLRKAPTSPWQPERLPFQYLSPIPTPSASSTPKEPDRNPTPSETPKSMVPEKTHKAPSLPNKTDGLRTKSGCLVKKPARFPQ
ncbi:hypothetical protein ElyMa_000682500 [Elysia marginata]|uniref:Uncharacterized protein n=1 Tax=Elysia marginata TaxID=1093978 RepID=A0AAV4GHW0_9GAST|nr:hypothetical protein ElyMa_000682500 [Elysia marginata]